MDLIENAVNGGHKVLLFSQFTSMLDILEKRMDEFKEKYNCVGDVRHIGLFSCVEFVKDKKTKEPIVPYGQDPYGKLPKIIGSLRAKGFLTFGHENMVLCNPPLIITEEQLLEELDKLEAVIQHNESPISTWEPHEYDLNLTYADDIVAFSPYLRSLREAIRDDTKQKIADAQKTE